MRNPGSTTRLTHGKEKVLAMVGTFFCLYVAYNHLNR